MAQRTQSKGTCTYCGKELAKGGITKHLAACPERQAVIAKAEQGKSATEMLYHLRVQDAYRKEFWLDLEMRGSKSLKDLDTYLRAIWLECCGHLSEFLGSGGLAQQLGKQRKIAEVFASTSELTHIYDMGTSSETLVKLVGTREGKPTTRPIALMARNAPPEDPCIECGQRATHLCTECLIEEETWGALCDEHAETHPHNNYGEPIPLVNSPRLGMCGYDGPADPPY
ncbi:hypothetical protein H6F43_05115 [Leptolyngbya sp. FACHB-36]|uniref:hypothetical protein n=1 Tax=Leptolyngbya sp. FACHB-36 TaxID=2692808 RepID=UPI0016818BFD|nr:hypothetical protein [Leptolyngbya sp. FACHB-36]MBD2019564.1 hypothetical protein [Leptolyngbya sp. FACHB-36]